MRNFTHVVKDLWHHTKLSLAAVSTVSLLTLSPVAVHADNYGSGVYGNGVYNSSSIPSSGSSGSSSSGSAASSTPSSSSGASESTVVQTPSGLEVAINLSDGQAIPSTGYYITITPLNGQGKTFDKAEIYLDGVLAYSGTPDSTGTLKWLWDTAKNPATKVKVIVYGPGSGTTTHEFNVTVTPVESASNTTQTPSTSTPESTPTTSGWPLWLTWTIIGVVLLVIILVIWLIARRRRQNRQLPPPTFTGV
jgi:hypothetical protein